MRIADGAAHRPRLSSFSGRLDSARGIAALVVALHVPMLSRCFSDRLQLHPDLPTGSLPGWLPLGTPLRVPVSGRAAAVVFLVLSGFVLALLASGLMLLWYSWPVRWGWIDRVGAAAVVAAMLSPGRIGGALRRPPLPWLGRVSSSLRLVHVPAMPGGNVLLHALLPQPVLIPRPIAASLPAAQVFHRLVEQPSARLAQRLFRPVPASAVPPAFGVLGEAGAG